MSDLKKLLSPDSVAVIGASTSEQKLGYTLLKNVIDYGFKGDLYPINPKADEILGLKAYPSVSAIGKPVDVVLFSIPGQFVLPSAEDAAKSGAGFAVILSSGFGEAGEEGMEAQYRMKEISEESGTRFVGPNCMGVYNNPAGFNGTYFWELPRREGNVSFVSQSGAYGGIMFNQLRTRGMGVDRFVSVGNMADLNHRHFIEVLTDEPTTEVVALFVEGIKDPEETLKAIRACSKKKPVIIFKAGRSEAGVRAAKSHTGSLAGDYKVFLEAMRSAGAVVCKESLEFFDLVESLSASPGRLPKSPGVTIMTISGGPCVVSGDLAEEIGLAVPELDDATQDRLKELTPPFSATSNPVDMTPQVNPANYHDCVDTVMGLDEIGGCIAINVGLDNKLFSDAFIAARDKYDKPVISFTIDTQEITSGFREAGIPIFPTPERAVIAYHGLVRTAKLKEAVLKSDAKVPHEIVSHQMDKLFVQGIEGTISEVQSKQVLSEIGIETVLEDTFQSFEEAIDFADAIGFPVAAKIHSAEIAHKTESGGVILNLMDRDDLRNAFKRLKEKFGADCEILVSQMAEPGVEIIIGGKRDDTFGPVVTFGLGGTTVELFGDISLRLCPVTPPEALKMIEEIKAKKLLTGFRGSEPVNLDLIADAVSKVSRLMRSYKRITELDINPLIATPRTLTAVDAMMVLK